MTRRILKWPVPVDDRDHPIGGGPVVHVDCQNEQWDVVHVWTDEPLDDDIKPRSARVYGTGQQLPVDDHHVGSVVAGPLVWHVLASDRPAPLREVL